MKTKNPSAAFDNRGDALANADAHGAKGAARFGGLQLISRCGDQSCAACAERKSDSDGAAVGIYVRSVVGEIQITRDT
jgi:hypothetical protein